MRRLRIRPLLVLASVLAPDVASACAICLDSARGSRGFGWAYIGLMLAPFAVVAALAGVLAWSAARAGRRRRPAPPPALVDARARR